MLTHAAVKKMFSLTVAATSSLCLANVAQAGRASEVSGSGSSYSGSTYVSPSLPEIPLDPQAAARAARAAEAAARAERAEARKARAEEQRAAREEQARKAREAAAAEERRIEEARRQRLAQERRTLGALQSAMQAELQSERKTHLVDRPNSIADFKRRDDQTIHSAEREQKEQEYRWERMQEVVKSVLMPEKPGPETTAKDVTKLVTDRTRLGQFQRQEKVKADAHELSRIIIKQSKPRGGGGEDSFESADAILEKTFSSSKPRR